MLAHTCTSQAPQSCHHGIRETSVAHNSNVGIQGIDLLLGKNCKRKRHDHEAMTAEDAVYLWTELEWYIPGLRGATAASNTAEPPNGEEDVWCSGSREL